MNKIVVLISGNGSNLQAILDSCESAVIQGTVAAVFSDKPDAFGLQRAHDASVPAIFSDPAQFSSRAEFDASLITQIDRYQPDLVVLAGYMRILSDDFVNHYAGRMLNVHPSLLPKYPGLHTHKKAIEAKDNKHGTSVHFVTPELDGGPVVLQASVPVFPDDTPELLQERVQTQEHKIYPLTIQWFLQGRLKMANGKAVLDGNILGSRGYADE
ncbi:phosphoribosylglycinamide formyltransferase [Vibrio sp. HA2012]|uniref:phosphoribosylglycinamide formyltransferase n=1 Tax=Vibrio sp. HA2012 TaxID=1971595 RepID=UPI000C2CC8B7|nr:phosphoribosylglycinamide formyltransferase [Vibrio sp. HA2012]PJC86556.1 phosphoribosylglycinamide formyltransferase [Vibrio sp. HA2012]